MLSSAAPAVRSHSICGRSRAGRQLCGPQRCAAGRLAIVLLFGPLRSLVSVLRHHRSRTGRPHPHLIEGDEQRGCPVTVTSSRSAKIVDRLNQLLDEDASFPVVGVVPDRVKVELGRGCPVQPQRPSIRPRQAASHLDGTSCSGRPRPDLSPAPVIGTTRSSSAAWSRC